MDYYMAVALVFIAFLGIIAYVKERLRQRSLSCTCGPDCGVCKLARPLAATSDCSPKADQTGNEKT